MSGLDVWLSERLADLEGRDLRRHLRVVESPQETALEIDGRTITNFSSNDYLGLAADARLREAGIRALTDAGSGSGASRLISGTHRIHVDLEEALAEFKNREAALSFANGTAAALGAIPALAGKGDILILDKLSHACLIDAARLSGAEIRIFPHNNLERLEELLKRSRAKSPRARIGVITESIFSMDGDRAPLAQIAEIKDRHGAWLLVDEAHATGIFGDHGRGLIDSLGLTDQVDIQLVTLGKALGSAGGAVVGSRKLIDYLSNSARTFIFSTAPPPSVAAMALEAIRLLASGVLEDKRSQLFRNMADLQERLGNASEPTSAIFPIPMGAESRAVRTANELYEQGIWVPAIRYPTVARGRARLRATLTASHTADQIQLLADALTRSPAS